jgi:two-component system OmpR family sensor kinase
VRRRLPPEGEQIVRRPSPIGRRPLPHLLRLPISTRLTIAFAIVMAAVLGAAGVFIYAQSRTDLDAQIDAVLQNEADDVKALVTVDPRAAVASSGVPLAQIYSADGRLLATSPKAGALRLLTRAEAARAVHRAERIETRALPSLRIRAIPATAQSGALRAVAVADPLDRRDQELDRLSRLLLIVGPLALLVASIAAYELARAALRPVDRMRERAEQITDRQIAERLPLSESNDEIDALGRTLNAMLDRAEAAIKRERRLVSDASHELRTPLTTLRAEVDLALMGDRNPDELRSALESASEEARRMSRLAEDLLVLARADQGRLPIHRKTLPPRELLDAAAARARAAAEMRGRSVVVRDQLPDESRISADADRAAQALDNLVKNTLLYGDGTITLSAQGAGDLVELHVTDEGPGFPDELIARPFERFARGDEARAAGPGSGLGLALVQAIAAAHGGSAGARNRPGGGADVWIAFPRSSTPHLAAVDS